MGRRAAVGLREPCEPRRCVDENSAERLLAEQTLYCLISCVLNQIRRAYALQGPSALHFRPCRDLEKDSGDRISGRNSMKYLGKFGTPEWIRTTDLLLRRQRVHAKGQTVFRPGIREEECSEARWGGSKACQHMAQHTIQHTTHPRPSVHHLSK